MVQNLKGHTVLAEDQSSLLDTWFGQLGVALTKVLSRSIAPHAHLHSHAHTHTHTHAHAHTPHTWFYPELPLCSAAAPGGLVLNSGCSQLSPWGQRLPSSHPNTQWNLRRRRQLATPFGKLEPQRSVPSSWDSFQSLTLPFFFTLFSPQIFFLNWFSYNIGGFVSPPSVL